MGLAWYPIHIIKASNVSFFSYQEKMNDLFWTESLFGHGTSFGHKFKNTNLTYGPILRGQVTE